MNQKRLQIQRRVWGYRPVMLGDIKILIDSYIFTARFSQSHVVLALMSCVEASAAPRPQWPGTLYFERPVFRNFFRRPTSMQPVRTTAGQRGTTAGVCRVTDYDASTAAAASRTVQAVQLHTEWVA